MIDRRVGLLFGIFLLLLVIALVRSVWLQGVRGGELSADAAASSPQVVVPGTRGRILDRNGQRARRLRGRGDDRRHSLPGGGPGAGGPTLAPILGVEERELLETLSDDDLRVRLPRPKGRPADRRARPSARHRGDRDPPRQPPGLPRGRACGAGDRRRRRRQPGPDRARGRLRGPPARHRRRARGCARRARRRARARHARRADHGEDLQLTIDAALQARTEQVLAGIGETYHPLVRRRS